MVAGCTDALSYTSWDCHADLGQLLAYHVAVRAHWHFYHRMGFRAFGAFGSCSSSVGDYYGPVSVLRVRIHGNTGLPLSR